MYTVFVNNLNDPSNISWSVADGGKYQRHADGSTTSSSILALTNYVDISKYKYITYSRYATTASNPSSGMAFFDSNKNYISGIPSAANYAQTDYVTYTVGVPANAAYARFSLISNRRSEFGITCYKMDSTCIHDDKSPDKEIKLISPKLTLADNSAGSFVFTMNPTNIGIGEITRMKSEITVERDGDEIWSGRVLSEKKNYWNQREFTCEGELAYLNDILQPPAAYNDMEVLQFLTAIIAKYNEKASIHRRFEIGAVDVIAYTPTGGSSDTITTTTNYSRTLDVIKDTLLDKYEGHIRVRKNGGIRYLDYFRDYVTTSSQTITFQDNLTDFTSNWDESELATVIIPYGKKLDEIDSELGHTERINPSTYSDRRIDTSSQFGSFVVYDGWLVKGYADCDRYSALIFNNGGSSSSYNCFYDSTFVKLSTFTVSSGQSRIPVPDDAYYFAISNDIESCEATTIDAVYKTVTGITYKLNKTRNNSTYDVEFSFTFHNPGVPSLWHNNPDTNEREYDTFDYSIWLHYKRVGVNNYSSKVSDTEEGTWTMKAGDTTNKTWTTTVTGLLPNETYTWHAEVHQINNYTGAGGNQSMGSNYETGEHTFTVAFTDSELDGVEKRLTVASVNNDDITVKNQNALNTYGRIEKVVTWETISDANKLLSLANWYLSDEQFDNMLIEIKSIDLHYLDPSFPAINLLDRVRAVSDPHGMDKLFPVTKMEIPLDQPENTVFTMGDTKKNSYTSSANASKNDIYNKIGTLPDTDDMRYAIGSAGERMLISAQKNTEQIMDTHTKGYITITDDGQGTMELIVSETEDYTQSPHYWRWNSGGLAHIQRNQDGTLTYNVGMNMDGEINADLITVGQMLVDRIKLYGLFGVYDQKTGTTPGGYIGYGPGLVGTNEYNTSTRQTRGLMISNTRNTNSNGNLSNNPRYFVVTDAGVRMNAGSQSLYLTDDSEGGNAAIIASNTLTIRASNIELYPTYDPATYGANAKDTVNHGELDIGVGKLILNKGFVIDFRYTGDSTVSGQVDSVNADIRRLRNDFNYLSETTIGEINTHLAMLDERVAKLRDRVGALDGISGY